MHRSRFQSGGLTVNARLGLPEWLIGAVALAVVSLMPNVGAAQTTPTMTTPPAMTTPTSMSGQQQTGNQRAMANYINSLGTRATGDLANALNKLKGLPPDQLAKALYQLSGE